MSPLYRTAVEYGLFVAALSTLELLLTEGHEDLNEIKAAQNALVKASQKTMRDEPNIFKEFRDRVDSSLAYAEQQHGIKDPIRLAGDDDTPARVVSWSYYHRGNGLFESMDPVERQVWPLRG